MASASLLGPKMTEGVDGLGWPRSSDGLGAAVCVAFLFSKRLSAPSSTARDAKSKLSNADKVRKATATSSIARIAARHKAWFGVHP